MARIARKNLKIFAGNASNNGVFGSFQAGNPTTTSDVETIQSLPAWAEGWNSATMTSKKLPPLQEFQGVQYVSTYQLGYLFQEGIAEWDEDCEYHEGSWVKSSASGIWSLYQSKINNNIGNSVLDTSKWALVSLGGSSRNVGEIVASTIPLSDAGLHLLDGTLITGTGAYSAFVDYIASIYAVNKNYFCSEADWQNSVATYGVCGKFVYSSLNNTVRLPKITGFIEGTSGASDLGNVISAGLPNITGTVDVCDDRASGYSGAFYNTNEGSPNCTDSGWSNTKAGFDASRSSSIYGNSNTVQPQAVKVLYYIVISNSTKTQIEIDIDDVMSDLAGKADIDLSNINASASAKETIVDWCMPDYSAGVSVSNITSSQSYTAVSDGYLFGTTYNVTVYVNGSQVGYADDLTYGFNLSIPLTKGDIVTASGSGNFGRCNFYPLKGVSNA